MTKKPRPTPPLDIAVRQAHGWVAASILQGERLLKLIVAQVDAGLPSEWSPEQQLTFDRANRVGWDHLTEEFEAYYFLCALRQADRWLNHAQEADRPSRRRSTTSSAQRLT